MRKAQRLHLEAMNRLNDELELIRTNVEIMSQRTVELANQIEVSRRDNTAVLANMKFLREIQAIHSGILMRLGNQWTDGKWTIDIGGHIHYDHREN